MKALLYRIVKAEVSEWLNRSFLRSASRVTGLKRRRIFFKPEEKVRFLVDMQKIAEEECEQITERAVKQKLQAATGSVCKDGAEVAGARCPAN